MDIWKDLEGLDVDLPEDGTGPPNLEDIDQQDAPKGMLWEITTKIYVWTDMDNHKYQLTSSQNMAQLGELTFEEAQKRMKRNRRSKGA